MVQLVRLAARGARRGTRRDASGGVPLGRVRPGQAAARFLTSDKRGAFTDTIGVELGERDGCQE
eukprot:scaffold6448_cov124-Isochrysis_galbana.AAC.9